MARFMFFGRMTVQSLLVLACALMFLCLQTPIANAQAGAHPPGPHPGGAARTGAPHAVAPPLSHPPIPGPMITRPHVTPGPRFPLGSRQTIFRPRVIVIPHVAGFVAAFPFTQSSIFFHRRFFFGGPFFTAPFFQFGFGLGFTTIWWPNCSPYWSFGYYCNGLAALGPGIENYFAVQPYQPPVYAYGPEQQPLVWLYLKGGTVYSATDYWFVNGQLHFIAIEEGGAQSAEQVINADELDVQKTIDINTRRGFRVVMREEPIDQYLRDHPNSIPPLLQASHPQ